MSVDIINNCDNCYDDENDNKKVIFEKSSPCIIIVNDNPNINIYRYNFDENVMEQLSGFAKIHQHDDRKTYKESWKNWLEENKDLVKCEQERLISLGYEGDVIDKMYKAARYYFRKKSNVKPDPKKRRKYISMEQEILTEMDHHIIRNMSSSDYTPSKGYSEFCSTHIDFIKTEINRMIELGISTDEISVKFKKTYKNRYFIISRTRNNLSDMNNFNN